MNAHGTVHKYGDHVDTDVIIPARYLASQNHQELASHCMEDIDKTFVTKVKDGEVTVRVLSDKAKTNPIDERTIAADGFAEDDYVVFTVDFNEDEDFYFCELIAPETKGTHTTYPMFKTYSVGLNVNF